MTAGYASGAHASNLGRRDLLRLLGWSLAGTALHGCARKPTASRDLRFWGTGTLDVGPEHWAELNRSLGIRMIFKDNNNDPGPVIAQMANGSAASDYDIGGLQGGAERELAEAGLIIPWEESRIPNWEGVWELAKNIRYTIVNGRRYGIPSVINADSMIYLPDKVGKIDSYSAIFDPKLKGKVAMEDAWINSVIFTAIFLKENSMASIRDPGDLTPDELGTVMEYLVAKKRAGQFRTFWNGWEQGVQLVKSQEVWVMTGWEPIVYAAKSAGVNAEYAVPVEGYEGWSNDLILHRGAQERGLVDLAHEFVNWELNGYYGAALAQLRGYVVPSDAAIGYARANPTKFDPVKQEALSAHVQDKFRAMKGQVYWQNVRPAQHELYDEWWAKLKAA
jgi:putative spermidine/putrescine transport system substrate-binding protein